MNPEDARAFAKTKVRFTLEDVERVRRGHRNDLENILPFFAVGFFYVLTNPNVTVATSLIKVAAVARIAHTIVYTVIVMPQPTRGLLFSTHFFITVYMAFHTIFYVL